MILSNHCAPNSSLLLAFQEIGSGLANRRQVTNEFCDYLTLNSAQIFEKKESKTVVLSQSFEVGRLGTVSWVCRESCLTYPILFRPGVKVFSNFFDLKFNTSTT
jgi:hypothetical protein